MVRAFLPGRKRGLRAGALIALAALLGSLIAGATGTAGDRNACVPVVVLSLLLGG